MKETRSSETASSAPQSGLRALVGSVFTGDRVLWIIVAALAVISVLVVYSSTAKMAYDAHTARTTAHFLRQQLIILVVSLIILVAVQKINCRIYNLFSRPVYFLSVALTVAVYFIGATTNGAARWIPVAGFQFQPSEALKVATILLLARRLSSCQSKIDRIRIVPSLNPFRWGRPAQRKIWREGTRPILLPVVLSCAVIFPAHTSSAMLVFLTSLVMMLIGRVRVSELVRLVGLACAALLLAGWLNLGRSETAGGRAHLAAQERYERLCSAAEMETRKLTLSAKQKVLAETYDRALEILCSMPREEYLSLLVRLLKAAGGKGDEKIALSAKDRDEIGETLVERANKELNAHYTLAGEAADIRAGLVLISKECDVNCSFETLLALSREKTERGAAKLLFAE